MFSAPADLALTSRVLWVSNQNSTAVTRLNPSTGKQIGRPIPVGGTPLDIATQGETVWVANFGSDTVTRIDPPD